jgi:hypothetical protein
MAARVMLGGDDRAVVLRRAYRLAVAHVGRSRSR